MNLTGISAPPFVTEETSLRGLHTALVRLDEWAKGIELRMEPEILAQINQRSPRPELPDYELLVAATSVWQHYRTIRSIRAMRIAYDWAIREFEGHPSLEQQMIRLVMSIRQILQFACTTPSEFRANAATQSARMQQFINSVFGAGGNQQQGQ